MSVKDGKTEQLIKETAKRIFLTEGKMLATTQDIADAAGVNRTLLHYYFRSRDVLFNMVFKEALTKLRTRVHEVLGSEMPFKQKVENLVNVFYEELTESPYLETFIALHLNQEPEKYEELFIALPGGRERMKNFLKEIQREMDKGTIAENKPVNFFINLFALMAYPFVARPIYLKMFDLTNAGYNKLLTERKSSILSTLFKN
ncbi:TetR/AcrR family transcriptional regulator [Segetibacter sp.]|jgi:TetR/AcrR family transcriptional regulator|uniref:TetR/AcrR family transcriptional regulator n=1 Tax=Segetibacter sp. TaxID=2231182 RepID=UPI00262F96E8|nr:TetR/AcrR family transcriptional regulator [Segetibacter sp.]MCW3081936.1 TetR family transcriptional regulator [Segetibacter sp.]